MLLRPVAPLRAFYQFGSSGQSISLHFLEAAVNYHPQIWLGIPQTKQVGDYLSGISSQLTKYLTEGSDDDLGMFSDDEGEQYCKQIIDSMKLLIEGDLDEDGLQD